MVHVHNNIYTQKTNCRYNEAGLGAVTFLLNRNFYRVYLFLNGIPFEYDSEGNYTLNFIKADGRVDADNFEEADSIAHAWIENQS